ncbi:glycosyltransferase family protein [Pseudokineococcus sp. 1T1Z-3]|uniref:glycosyltransferase family protein n=1 Tax=Pseudokineococcus sp. 1T1Z-3 TaxID=3132745 RepID=UPI0030A923D7
MRVLVAGHTAPGGVFTVGSHHLAREMAAAGHDVVHLSSPVSLLHLARARDPEVRRRLHLARGTHEAAPGVPGLLPLTVLPLSVGPLAVGPLALRTALPALRRSLAAVGADDVDVLLVDQPLAWGLEQVVRCRTMVYRSTDVVEAPAKLAGEARLVAKADGLVATSAYVLAGLRRHRADLPSLVLDNGVDFSRFAAPGGEGRRGSVYVGAVDDRFDWEAVRSLAEAAPCEPVDVYGPPRVPVPHLPGNVVLHGEVAYERTPDLLRGARVGLLPFARTPMNAGRSPMKLFEYLAAGLQVVTTMPPSVSPAPPGVHLLDAGTSAVDVMGRALAEGVNAAGLDAARSMDWAARAQTLVDYLEELLASSPRRAG